MNGNHIRDLGLAVYNGRIEVREGNGKEHLCEEKSELKELVDYQLEVDKGKLTAVANLKS